MSLSMDDIRRIADLGRIDISDEQARIVQGELNDIFQMIERISSVNTDGIEPMPNPHDGVQRCRQRERGSCRKHEECSGAGRRLLPGSSGHRITV